MKNEKDFDYFDNDEDFTIVAWSDEQLAEIYLERAREWADTTLQLARNCYRRFGKQLLSDEQKQVFENMASGILPTDEEMAAMESEQITLDMQDIKKARELNKQKAAQLGEAYKPELRLEDKTRQLFGELK
jgi:hypothetical protein